MSRQHAQPKHDGVKNLIDCDQLKTLFVVLFATSLVAGPAGYRMRDNEIVRRKRPVSHRVSGPKDPDNWRTAGSCQMHRTCISSYKQAGSTGQGDKLGDRGRKDHWGVAFTGFDKALHQTFLPGPQVMTD